MSRSTGDLLGGMHLVLQIELPDVCVELLDVGLAFFEVQQVELFDVTLRRDHL